MPKTMETHYSKHHAWYTKKLNAAVEWTDWAERSIEDILTNLDSLPADKKQAIINNGGGYYNHSLFWTMLSPQGWGTPSGHLAESIDSTFWSFDSFKEQFTAKATSVFGSGWAWLCVESTLITLPQKNVWTKLSTKQRINTNPWYRRMGTRILPQLPK